MSDLAAFLLARVAEDEAAARSGDGGLLDEDGARFDRTRVLAECEAKRRIVEAVLSGFYDSDLEVALRALAAVYTDHPDYRPEWRE